MVRVNVVGMDDGYDHACCYFCAWGWEGEAAMPVRNKDNAGGGR